VFAISINVSRQTSGSAAAVNIQFYETSPKLLTAAYGITVASTLQKTSTTSAQNVMLLSTEQKLW
jgi:hypothetical protein